MYTAPLHGLAPVSPSVRHRTHLSRELSLRTVLPVPACSAACRYAPASLCSILIRFLASTFDCSSNPVHLMITVPNARLRKWASATHVTSHFIPVDSLLLVFLTRKRYIHRPMRIIGFRTVFICKLRYDYLSLAVPYRNTIVPSPLRPTPQPHDQGPCLHRAWHHSATLPKEDGQATPAEMTGCCEQAVSDLLHQLAPQSTCGPTRTHLSTMVVTAHPTSPPQRKAFRNVT